MTDRTRAWNEVRLSLGSLVSAIRSELAAQVPRAADELAAAAPHLKAHVSERIAAAVPHVADGLWATAPHLVRRGRRPAMAAGPLGLLSAFAGGALVMHFCDPERGSARRQLGAERIAAVVHFGTIQVRRAYRLAGDRRRRQANETALAAAQGPTIEAGGEPTHPTSSDGPAATSIRETGAREVGLGDRTVERLAAADPAQKTTARRQVTERRKPQPAPATRPGVSSR